MSFYLDVHYVMRFSVCFICCLHVNLFNNFIFINVFIFQTLTPHMQLPEDILCTPRSSGKLLGPALGDQHQGYFSINLWKSAFRDAFSRICPVRAGGHECGCLPVLARKARLDITLLCHIFFIFLDWFWYEVFYEQIIGWLATCVHMIRLWSSV